MPKALLGIGVALLVAVGAFFVGYSAPPKNWAEFADTRNE